MAMEKRIMEVGGEGEGGKIRLRKSGFRKMFLLLSVLCLLLSGCALAGQGTNGSGGAAASAQEADKEAGDDSAAAPGTDKEAGDGSAAAQGAPRENSDAGTVVSGTDGEAGDSNAAASGTLKGAGSAVASGAGESGEAFPAASGQGSAQAPQPSEEPKEADYDFTVCFAGDINLDENWCTTQYLDAQENGIYDCISQEFLDIMNAADIMCLNNEFAYSTKGAPLEGKAYTFRAMPERVEILHQMGVDAVTLANNHIYDYGKEALLDTFSVLEEAGVPYFGAGRTLEEARQPLYLEVEGRRIAFVGASRAEKNKMTPQATDTEPGILRCYDTELFQESIREAKANADFCIAFVHWGTEYSFDLEQVQLDTGKEYLDAGADAVIGAHSHCLQGMEYYDGKPIVYSLGNYWFNEKTLDTMLLQLHFSGNDGEEQMEVQVIPGVQAGYRTTYASEAEEQRRIYDFLESISVNVEISDEGIVTEKK